jgi:hypothetical protein
MPPPMLPPSSTILLSSADIVLSAGASARAPAGFGSSAPAPPPAASAASAAAVRAALHVGGALARTPFDAWVATWTRWLAEHVIADGGREDGRGAMWDALFGVLP